jgi:hypothetical protein
MSVSKKNVDTMNTKKIIVKEVTRKRRLADMQASVTALEERVGDPENDVLPSPTNVRRRKRKTISQSFAN